MGDLPFEYPGNFSINSLEYEGLYCHGVLTIIGVPAASTAFVPIIYKSFFIPCKSVAYLL